MKKIFIYNLILYMLFIIIGGRLFYLQVIKRDYYLEKLSNKQNKIVYENTSLRGRIYDRNNNLLVDNELILTIIYQKDEKLSIKKEIELAYNISKKIDLDYTKLTKSYLKDFYILENEKVIEERISKEDREKYQKRLISDNEYYRIKKDLVKDDDLDYTIDDKKAIYLYYLMNNGYSYMEKIIKENATIEEFMYFSENAHNLHGFDTKYLYGRKYLYNDTFKSILGSVGSIPYEKKDYYLRCGYSINDKVGLSNLELVYDEYLKGTKSMYLIKNKEKILVKEPEKGNDLKLTIDINLQKFVDDVLKKEVLNAKSGYNTHFFRHSYVMITDTYGGILSMSGKEYQKGSIIDVPIGNIVDTVTPGSVVKGASMIVGYDTKAISIGEIIKDECIKIKATPIKCSIYTMGDINDINALAYSSNVYQFKTAIRVGKGIYRYNESLKINSEAFDIYREYFERFGLGTNTGIELLNESRGYKGSNREPGLLLNFAIGQYDTYTNIQLNQYISTIARDGDRYKMHLLDEILDNQKVVLKYEKTILNNINVDIKYIKRVQEGLKAVMDYGSGRGYSTISASGKTGTSESFYDSNFDGKVDTETISLNFVMYYPTINPQVAISINSPDIGTPNSNYYYPINQNVMRNITSNIYKYLK